MDLPVDAVEAPPERLQPIIRSGSFRPWNRLSAM